jgi:crotonobetainyl-CoA:carnitine CoA-transferase CaiB-like acyl-CoA transferase
MADVLVDLQVLDFSRVLAGPFATMLLADLLGAFALAGAIGLDPIVEVPRAGGGSVRLTRNPIGLSATPPTYRGAPPSLGSS